jgi:serine/threonine protein phosphatase 1
MTTAPKLFALGDVHGHWTELAGLIQTLYAQADFQPARDTLVQVGDLVDGGPDTRQVVEWCMAMAARHPHWVFLKANHEDMMLDALRHGNRTYGDFYMWWGQGGRETGESYRRTIRASAYEQRLMQPRDYIPQAHLDWLEARPLYHETDRYIFVHAGLRPGIPLAAQAREDLLWIREEFIASRDDFGGKRVVFGHTPRREPLVRPNKIGIDTMSFNIGKLTAVDLSGAEPVFYHQTAVEGPW